MNKEEIAKINSIMYQSFQPYNIKEGTNDEVYTLSYKSKYCGTQFIPNLRKIGYHVEGFSHIKDDIKLYVRRIN